MEEAGEAEEARGGPLRVHVRVMLGWDRELGVRDSSGVRDRGLGGGEGVGVEQQGSP